MFGSYIEAERQKCLNGPSQPHLGFVHTKVYSENVKTKEIIMELLKIIEAHFQEHNLITVNQ